MADEQTKETTRVKMNKTVANGRTAWYKGHEYEIDPEVARAWLRDEVASPVGAAAKAEAADAAGDPDAPRASEVDPALQGEAQPVKGVGGTGKRK